jgi:hypothetical protein
MEISTAMISNIYKLAYKSLLFHVPVMPVYTEYIIWSGSKLHHFFPMGSKTPDIQAYMAHHKNIFTSSPLE